MKGLRVNPRDDPDYTWDGFSYVERTELVAREVRRQLRRELPDPDPKWIAIERVQGGTCWKATVASDSGKRRRRAGHVH